MINQKNKPKKIVISALSLFIVIFVMFYFALVILIPSDFLHLALPYRRADSFRRYYSTMVDNIHDVTGRVITSQDEIDKSMYYPYFPCRNLYSGAIKLKMSAIQKNQTIYYHTSVDYKNSDWRHLEIGWNIDINSKNDSKKLETFYLSGEKAILQNVFRLRSGWLYNWNDAIILAQKKVGLKQTPSPNPIWDLPRNKAELSEYIQFLKTIEGDDELKDFWGNPLRFSIVSRKLKCESAGSDKMFGTKDDIVTYVIVK